MTSVLTSLRYFRLRLRWALDDNRISIVAFAVLLIAAGAVSLGRTLTARQAAPAPVVLIATPTLGLLPTDAPLAVANVGPVLPRAAVAYAAPGGLVLGGLEPGRSYVPLARYGASWLQVDAGSGPVWVLASEAGLTIDAALADLQPQPTAVVVVVREVQQQTVYIAAPPPAAPAEPYQPPATGAAEVMANGATEAALRAEGAAFSTMSEGTARQAGPATCSNEGRACYGSKP
jgi:hypothetical protein